MTSIRIKENYLKIFQINSLDRQLKFCAIIGKFALIGVKEETPWVRPLDFFHMAAEFLSKKFVMGIRSHNFLHLAAINIAHVN